MRKPDFENLTKVLSKKKPERPTLFEFFLNGKLHFALTGMKEPVSQEMLDNYRWLIKSFGAAGYDYATVGGSKFGFPRKKFEHLSTMSQNEGFMINDRKSFEAYKWQDPESFDYSPLEKIEKELPEGMRLIVCGPGGVLENVTFLVGYDNMCFMSLDDPELLQEIFDSVGSRLLKYYEICSPFKSVGALISNDDWGFKTQTMLGPKEMRTYVFPWHKKIVNAIHKSKKPAILHSCGNLVEVMDEVIDDMKYDGKHSYEDNIIPVEQAYEKWGGRIAILGGLDLDFVCSSSPEKVHERSLKMLERSEVKGAYGLGSGNSIPEYVPFKNYFAMISAATGLDYSKFH